MGVAVVVLAPFLALVLRLAFRMPVSLAIRVAAVMVVAAIAAGLSAWLVSGVTPLGATIVGVWVAVSGGVVFLTPTGLTANRI